MSQSVDLEAARPEAPAGFRSRLKSVGTIIGGVALVLGGLALLVLPGPGLVVLAGGLAVLATEIPWLRIRLGRGFDRLPARVRAKTPRRLVEILHPAD